MLPTVTPSQALNFFGDRDRIRVLCKVTRTAVYHWIKQGWIPYDKQCLLQVEAERMPRRNGKRCPVASWHDIPAERRAA